MISRNMERLGGVFIFLTSLSGYLYILNLIRTAHYWYPKWLSLAAAFIVIGFSLIIFPGYRRERIERGENIENLEGMKLLTTKWRIILALSIAAAMGNLMYFQFAH